MSLQQHPDDLTGLVRRMRAGDAQAGAQLLSQIYGELHRMARRAMSTQRADHSLGATGLLHEAYLKLRCSSSDVADRQHFLLVAASAMRSILVDHARARRREKRTPPGERLLLDELLEAVDLRGIDVIGLQDALALLERRDPQMAKLVDLRFFADLSVTEAAAVLGLSPRQAAREWATARAWLRKELA